MSRIIASCPGGVALGKQRQEDLWVPGQAGQHRELLSWENNKEFVSKNNINLDQLEGFWPHRTLGRSHGYSPTRVYLWSTVQRRDMVEKVCGEEFLPSLGVKSYELWPKGWTRVTQEKRSFRHHLQPFGRQTEAKGDKERKYTLHLSATTMRQASRTGSHCLLCFLPGLILAELSKALLSAKVQAGLHSVSGGPRNTYGINRFAAKAGSLSRSPRIHIRDKQVNK